jgi:multidrug resistance efflux pump
MRTFARLLLTFVIVAAGCAGGYELWDYYMFSPWTRDARVQADVVTIAPDVAGFVDDLRVKDNQFVHKGEVLFVIDRERYTRLLATAEANVAARKADMDMRQKEAARRVRLTNLAISDEARQNAVLTANSATAAHQQAVTDRSTAQLNLDRTVVRGPSGRVRTAWRAGRAVPARCFLRELIALPRDFRGTAPVRIGPPGMITNTGATGRPICS